MSADPQNPNAFLFTGVAAGTGSFSYTIYYYYETFDPANEPECDENLDTYTDGGNVSVTPTVTISTPASTTITAGAVDPSSNPKQYTFTANGDPSSGGSYSWTSSSSALTLTNASTATVSVVGVSAGTATLTITYTVNGQSATATQNVTILKANSIYVSNDTVSTFQCGMGLTCIRRVLTYDIRSDGTRITDAIMLLENVPNTTDSCSKNVSTGNSPFNSIKDTPGTGYQFDDYLNDCPTTFYNSCSFSFTNQQWQQQNADGSYTTIGTVGAVAVTSGAEATVAGNNTSLTGHTFYP